jgi:hypothetical protein
MVGSHLPEVKLWEAQNGHLLMELMMGISWLTEVDTY